MAKTRWDVEIEFNVGSSEVHHVKFTWGQTWGETRMDIDGREVLRERRLFGIKRLRRYQISVGESERHDVVVERTWPSVFGGLRKQSFRVLVDNEFMGAYTPESRRL